MAPPSGILTRRVNIPRLAAYAPAQCAIGRECEPHSVALPQNYVESIEIVYQKEATKIKPQGFNFGCFWGSIFNESRNANEITDGEEILVSLGRNLQPATSDEIKSANYHLASARFHSTGDFIPKGDLFRNADLVEKSSSCSDELFFWWSIFNENRTI